MNQRAENIETSLARAGKISTNLSSTSDKNSNFQTFKHQPITKT